MKRSTLIAVVALFFSIAGVGFAAGRYVITSPSQIKPSALRAIEASIFDRTYQVMADRSLHGTAAQPVVAECSQGDHVLNGGFVASNGLTSATATVTTSAPSLALHDGWTVVAHLDSEGQVGSVRAWAVCIPHD